MKIFYILWWHIRDWSQRRHSMVLLLFTEIWSCQDNYWCLNYKSFASLKLRTLIPPPKIDWCSEKNYFRKFKVFTFSYAVVMITKCRKFIRAILSWLHGPSMLPDKAKFVECSIISLALSFWMKHLVIGQLQKPAKFSAFHWSPSWSQAFIGQHLGTSRVVHLPKRTVMVLFTISDA